MEQLSLFDFLDAPKSNKPTELVIAPTDITIISVETYTYVREVDGKTMYAFLCECDNGMLYKKDFLTYHHMVENTSKNKNLFYQMIEKEKNYNKISKIEGYTPTILEMHRCRKDVDWEYAEARYSGCEKSNYYKYSA